MPIEHHPEYIHHQKNDRLGASMRELVFGMEDGMVSTLGAITGIAAAMKNHYAVVVSGFIIVAVESISMAVGSYLSSKSERSIDERKLEEEKTELEQFPMEEEQELVGMYVQDGWTPDLARQMAGEAARNKGLFLQEMAYRELNIIQDKMENPLRNGVIMGFSYVVGGVIPLISYFFLPLPTAIYWSIVVTLIGLFVLGVGTTKYSHRVWWRAGLEMLLLASAAAIVGYVVGQMADAWLRR
ncbi:MAG: VIT1/CCC1 transporter family protein [Candidatus Magasanikbacteria bacterium]|nr:VIT1/CCC1 transporter family protein [Candidatus Magasanikbacteria bacterium]